MSKSNIQWTEETWNPTTGCTKVSTGCKRCYAEKMHARLKGMGQEKYAKPFDVFVMHPKELTRNFGKKPKLIFINSMSDLFHEDCTLEYIQQVFAAIARNPHHTYQALTKRDERLAELSPYLTWPDNLWMGVSIEDRHNIGRADNLRKSGAKVKWLSLEPLVGFPTFLSVLGIDWIVVGGESGKGSRTLELWWLDELLMTCKASNVPVFVKQLGSALAKSMKLVHPKGGNLEEWPEKYQVREWPAAASGKMALPVIEARQLTWDNQAEVRVWCGGKIWSKPPLRAVSGLFIPTEAGQINVAFGDVILKYLDGSFKCVDQLAYYAGNYEHNK